MVRGKIVKKKKKKIIIDLFLSLMNISKHSFLDCTLKIQEYLDTIKMLSQKLKIDSDKDQIERNKYENIRDYQGMPTIQVSKN